MLAWPTCAFQCKNHCLLSRDSLWKGSDYYSSIQITYTACDEDGDSVKREAMKCYSRPREWNGSVCVGVCVGTKTRKIKYKIKINQKIDDEKKTPSIAGASEQPRKWKWSYRKMKISFESFKIIIKLFGFEAHKITWVSSDNFYEE